MTTYYVSKAGNNTNTGLSGSGAKLTIAAALTVASTTGDVVEIIDEGVYQEDGLDFSANNATLRHTASHLGYATLDGRGSQVKAFRIGAYTGGTLIGLEIKDYISEVFNAVGGGHHNLHLSGCFIHNIPAFCDQLFSASGDDPMTIKQCIMFFEPASNVAPIYNDGFMEISNCLITSSTSTGNWGIMRDYNIYGTASFSTFINRSASLTDPILQCAKVINCIVSGSGGKGISSNDHTYNLVHVGASSASFQTHVTHPSYGAGEEGTAGTGEFAGRAPDFVDGDAVGAGIAVAENYQIKTTSYAYDAGVFFDSIAVDITGSTRAFCDYKPDMGCFELLHPIWRDYDSEAYRSLEGDFTINHNKNLSSNYKYGDRNCEDPKQAPFSRGVKGPANLRGRTKAYVTSNGGNPKEISN